MATADGGSETPFTYIWTIENVSELTDLQLESPRFVPQSLNKTKWYLALHQYVDFCCVLRADGACKDGPTSIGVEFSLLSPDGVPLIVQKSDKHTFFIFLMPMPVFAERWKEFIHNNTLTIRCRMWRKKHKISTTDICCARTRLKTYTRSFIWPIEEFSALNSSISEDLSELALDEKKVYPLKSFNTEEPLTALILFLKRNSKSEDLCVDFLIGKDINFGYSIEVSVLDVNGEIIASIVERSLAGIRKNNINIRNIISKNKLINKRKLFLPNDTLLLKCSFEICTGITLNEIEYCTPNVSPVSKEKEEVLHFQVKEMNANKSSQFEEYFYKDHDVNGFTYDSADEKNKYNCCNETCSLKSALKYLHSENTFSDVSLRIGTKLFPVHKNILCSRSSVFGTIFCMNMKENIIGMNEMEENTLCRLLQYIYTDTVEELQFENALDLYEAAADYQLLELKDHISDVLIYKFSETNIREILSLANKYQDEKLQIVATRDCDSGLNEKLEINENAGSLGECNLI